jgi:hypothetical protein
MEIQGTSLVCLILTFGSRRIAAGNPSRATPLKHHETKTCLNKQIGQVFLFSMLHFVSAVAQVSDEYMVQAVLLDEQVDAFIDLQEPTEEIADQWEVINEEMSGWTSSLLYLL